MSDAANGTTLGRGEVIVMKSGVSQSIGTVTGSDLLVHMPGIHRTEKSTKVLVDCADGPVLVVDGFAEVLLGNRLAEL